VAAVTFLVRWALLALVVAVAAWTTPDVDLRRGAVSALLVAALIALANLVAEQVLRLLPTPDSLLLLAALTLLVNGLAVWLASTLTSRLDVDGFLAAVTFAMMVSVFSIALSTLGVKVGRRFEDT
jgi:putative membrane protein